MHTALGIGLGLIFGQLLHIWIMSQIHVKFLSFDVHIAPLSYILTCCYTDVLVHNCSTTNHEAQNYWNRHARALKSVE